MPFPGAAGENKEIQIIVGVAPPLLISDAATLSAPVAAAEDDGGKVGYAGDRRDFIAHLPKRCGQFPLKFRIRRRGEGTVLF